MNKSRSTHQIQGAPHILIDGFRHRIEPSSRIPEAYYILTHFHSDHYGGLTSKFNRGKIVCTPITKDLICSILGVNAALVIPVDLNGTITLMNTKVTFCDANHCPGAAILLIQLEDGSSVLHTGDMRFHPRMKCYPPLQRLFIDRIYLDTTYAHPKHDFLNQDQAIESVVKFCDEFLVQDPKGVVLLCAYNLGKERLITAVIDAVSKNAFVDEAKLKILQCLDEDMKDRIRKFQFVTSKQSSRFHICKFGIGGSVMPFFRPNFESLEEYRSDLIQTYNMEVSRIMVIIPTGWVAMNAYNKIHNRVEEGNCVIQLVPYSEHSNFAELKDCVQHFKPREVVPTVFKDVYASHLYF